VGKSDPTARVLLGCFLLPVACLVLAACLLPRVAFRVSYGRGPLDADPAKVRPGMTPEEVVEVLGPPHNTHDFGDGVAWTYFEDSLAWNYIGVKFTKEGVVQHWWVH
jgi:outer membrane protein assembly factor BamE (lipoprotein component of BamABCDE complex)